MADLKISQLNSIVTVVPATDVLPVVQGGTTLKITPKQILESGSPAVLASATITGDLTVDTNTLKVDSAFNRVGIGTATPAYKLEVATGTSGQQALASFRTADTTAANNAGIQIYATPSSTAASRSVLLSLDADGADASGGDYFFIQKLGNSGQVDLSQQSNAAMTFSTNGTERYRIASDGIATWSNVGGVAGTAMTLNSTGLGIAVSPTAAKLQVGSSALSSSPAAGATGHTFALGATAFGLAAGTLNTGNSYIQATRWDGSVTNYELVLQPNGGNVGIGVTPSAWSGTGSGQGVVQLGNVGCSIFGAGAGFSADNYCYFNNNAYHTTTGFKYFRGNGAAQYAQVNNSHRWLVSTNAQVADTVITLNQAMTLDASGNLLVGKTSVSPSNAGCELQTGTGGNAASVFVADGAFASIMNRLNSDGTIIDFRRQTSSVGYIAVTTLATTYNSISDYRLKEAVQPLVGGLARVSALKPSIYKWKVNGSDGEGFLAHELAEVVPSAVTGEKDAVNEDGSIKAQGVDMSRIVPILVAAIQELTARVQTLEAK